MRGAAVTVGIKDDAAEGRGREGVPEAEVAIDGGILGRVVVVELW